MEAVVIGIVIALLIAFIAVRIMISQMHPVARKREAAQYTGKGDVKFLVRDDVYLRTDVSRVKIARSNPQGGAPGGASIGAAPMGGRPGGPGAPRGHGRS